MISPVQHSTGIKYIKINLLKLVSETNFIECMYKLISFVSTRLDTWFREELTGQLGPRKGGRKTRIAKNVYLEMSTLSILWCWTWDAALF